MTKCVARVTTRLGLACFLLAVPAAYPSVAQEATTSPTCTGCSRPPAAQRPAKPHAAAPAKPRAVARPAVNNEGTWTGASVGPCIPKWTWTIEVNNGVISGKNTSGHVARSGAGQGVMVVFDKSYRFRGQFRGTSGSGTWSSAECSGSWTGAKS